MFRWFLIVVFGWAGLLLVGCGEREDVEVVQGKADGMEVRCYMVGTSLLGEVYDGELEVMEEAGFESRFLEGVTLIWDCREVVEGLDGVREFEGRAVYDVEGERLVVLAKRGVHGEIEADFSGRMPESLRTEVSVYLVPGVVSGTRDLFLEGPPEGAELVAGLSGVHLSGQAFQARTGDGKLSLELDTVVDWDDRLVDHRLTLRAGFEEASFELKTGVYGLAGVPMVIEVGSLDGERSVLVELKQDLVMPDGSLKDEWVLKEEGGAFLKEEGGAFLKEEGLAFLEGLALSRERPEEVADGVFRYRVPPTFESFLRPSGEVEDDPFATGDEGGEPEELPEVVPVYEGVHSELAEVGEVEWGDFKTLLRQNGLSFREGDFALLARGESALYVKLSKFNLELLEGVLMCPCPGPPQMVRVDFMEIEGVAEVSRKVGLLLLPGQNATVRLGDDLAVEIEAQIDGDYDLVDVRMMLSERGGDFEKASFRTGASLRSGESSMIHESRVGGRRKAWMVRASVVEIEEEIGKMRKESK